MTAQQESSFSGNRNAPAKIKKRKAVRIEELDPIQVQAPKEEQFRRSKTFTKWL